MAADYSRRSNNQNAAGSGNSRSRPARKTAAPKTGDKRTIRSSGRPPKRPAGKSDTAPATPQNRPFNPARSPSGDEFPPPAFAERRGMIDGLPSAMVVNTALKKYPYAADYPWNLRVSALFKAEKTSGQPTEAEEKVLAGFEKSLFAAVKKAGTLHLLGHTSWSGSREWNFYLDDPAVVDAALAKWLNAQPEWRHVEYEIAADSGWRNVEYYFDYS